MINVNTQQVAMIVLALAAAVAANSYGYNKPSYGHGYSAPAYKPAYSSYKAEDYSVSLFLINLSQLIHF